MRHFNYNVGNKSNNIVHATKQNIINFMDIYYHPFKKHTNLTDVIEKIITIFNFVKI